MSVDLTIENGVATVVLNRPEAMNALDPETETELQRIFRDVDRHPEIQVVVITGAGDRAFCAGADLKKTLAIAGSMASQRFGDERPAPSAARIIEIDKPVICAVNGVAVGGGMELAIACDIRIAAENARFGLTEVKIGSIPGSGGTQRLPRLIGMGPALHLLMTGAIIDAAEALRIGLVTRVVPFASLREEARHIADQIAANAPLAVRTVKHLAYAGFDMPLADGLDLERAYFGMIRETEDRKEGRIAFAEKRRPAFRGR